MCTGRNLFLFCSVLYSHHIFIIFTYHMFNIFTSYVHLKFSNVVTAVCYAFDDKVWSLVTEGVVDRTRGLDSVIIDVDLLMTETYSRNGFSEKCPQETSSYRQVSCLSKHIYYCTPNFTSAWRHMTCVIGGKCVRTVLFWT